MKKVNFHLIVVLFIVLCGCERQKIVDIDIEQRSKIFVAAFVGEGNDKVAVHVSRSFPAIGISDSFMETTPPIDDAQVFFQTPNGLHELFYDENEQRYLASLNGEVIQSNVNYHLKVQHRGEVSEGYAIIPDQANVALAMEVDSLFDSIYQTMFYTLQVKCKSFKDNQYISLQAVVVFEDSSIYAMNPKNMKSAFYLNNGQEVENVFNQSVQIFGLKPVRIEARAYSISKDLYLYQSKVGQFDLFSMFPFSEPTFIHSNMSSGIGIFGTYKLSNKEMLNLQ